MARPESYRGPCKDCKHVYLSQSYDGKKYDEYYCYINMKEEDKDWYFRPYDRKVHKNGSCEEWEEK